MVVLLDIKGIYFYKIEEFNMYMHELSLIIVLFVITNIH